MDVRRGLIHLYDSNTSTSCAIVTETMIALVQVAGCKVIVCVTKLPLLRTALIFQVEKDTLQVNFSSVGDKMIPTNDEGWLEFARSLPDPLIYNLVSPLTPVGEPKGYKRRTNVWKHYEEVSMLRC